jgi:4'-phosphopantetheinyl transferase
LIQGVKTAIQSGFVGRERVTEEKGKIIGPDSFSPRQLPLRQLEKPQGDGVHLWHLDLNRLSNPLNQETGTKPRELSEFQHRATRRFYLRLLLGAYLGLPGKDVHIARRIKGRPELDSAQSRRELDFSVARSNDCYLIGISSGACIGVDLEIAARRSGRPLALARRYFSKSETVALSTLGEDELHRAFMHTWSCKEAIVKANGLGIANQLYRFTVDVNPDNPPSVLDMSDDDCSAWKLAVTEPVSGAIAVVAVRQQGIRLEGFNLT